MWSITGIRDPFELVTIPVCVSANVGWETLINGVEKALKREKHFRRDPSQNGDGKKMKHQVGWNFCFQPDQQNVKAKTIVELAKDLDPLSTNFPMGLAADLHVHTAWSDGSASVNSMASAVITSGLKYFAVTDHSRSSKLQGGLTPSLWLRQANALTLAAPVCPVLHGIEVDILDDGILDLPDSLLAAADLVVASVHSNWSDDVRENTNRLLRAIESGHIDVIAHPTSAIVGKPGIPNYRRAPAEVYWEEVFSACARWRVALEMNCFPSRLDLSPHLLKQAIQQGCAVSLGLDAHARSHLLNLRFGEEAIKIFPGAVVLNQFSYSELKDWIARSREIRKNLKRSTQVSPNSQLPTPLSNPAQSRPVKPGKA